MNAPQVPENAPIPTLGKYRLVARLGTGGMADVYLAVAQGPMNVNRLVVIKRLRDEHAEDPEMRAMFLDEARLAARLNHPNVVQTFEADTESGSYFLAMEYVEGQPYSRILSKLRSEGRVLDPVLAVKICADALAGLDYAHEATDFDGTPLEIVHRDVSPQNLMVTYNGAVKLVDFGIAKAVGTTETAHGVFKGKVAFMAPEQILGDGIDRRADIFAAGIVLWESLVGRPLFAAETPAKTLHALMNKEVPPPSTLRAEVPQALDAIVLRALERDVDARYPSARAMRDALEGWLHERGSAATERVGALVQSLFAERRMTVQNQIKAQLATLAFHRGDDDVSSTQRRPKQAGIGIVDLSERSLPTIDAMMSHASMFRVVTNHAQVTPTGVHVSRPLIVATALMGLVAIAASVVLLRPAAPTETLARPARGEELIVPVAPLAATASPAPSPSALPAPEPQPPTTGSAESSAKAPVVARAAAPSPPAWRPPPPAAIPTHAPASAAPTPPASLAAPQPASKPAETSTGRTFRRTL